MGSQNIDRNVPAYVSDGTNPVEVFANASFAGGMALYPLVTNLYGYILYNPNTVDVFFKCFDTTNPVLGVDAATLCFQIPAGGSVVMLGSDIIYHFATSFNYACTTGYENTSFAIPALPIGIQIFYK